MHMKVKVGFLACHSENYFAMENNVIEHCLQGVMELANTMDVEIVSYPPIMDEGTEKVDNTVYIWYNVSIKYRRCFYDRTTAEIGAKSIHGNI